MTSNEAGLKALVRGHFGLRDDLTLWNNPVGEAWAGRESWVKGTMLISYPSRVTYGLCPGSSDLIGIQSVVIQPHHVGRTFGRFIGVELKDKATEQENQETFRNFINAMGGSAGIARGKTAIDDVELILRRGLEP